MLASLDKKQAKTSRYGVPKRDAVAGQVTAPEVNPLWQSLALQSNTIQPKLAPGQPEDPHEHEADRIADHVTRLSQPQIQRACACGGRCPKCQSEDLDHGPEHVQLKRSGSDSYENSSAPSIVHEVLRSAGQPLDSATRDAMEAGFDRDFGAVQVHTDARAAESAKAIGAYAYAVGGHVVFGSRQYNPHSKTGRELLAHELAHVVQQRGTVPITGPLEIGAVGTPSERLADEAAHAVGRGAVASPGLTAGPMIARQPVPVEAEPPARRVVRQRPRVPSRRPANENVPSRGPANENVPIEEQDPVPVEVPREYLGDQGSDTDWELNFDVKDVQDWTRMKQIQLERPTVEYKRGGQAPDFITKTAATSVAYPNGAKVTYTPSFFHIVDAIESDIDLATTPEHIYGLYLSYFPEDLPFSFALPKAWKAPDGNIYTPRLPPRSAVQHMFWSDPTIDDPTGQKRIDVFRPAFERRAKKVPALANVSLPFRLHEIVRAAYAKDVAALEKSYLEGKERKQEPCETKDVPRLGGNTPGAKRHHKYATQVTGGNPRDFQIKTPEGITCITDGRDRKTARLVWEVKTKHDWVTDDELAGTEGWPAFEHRISDLEDQRARCLIATTRCGYIYLWALERKEVKEALVAHWGGVPFCLHIPFKD